MGLSFEVLRATATEMGDRGAGTEGLRKTGPICIREIPAEAGFPT